jgi:hypothetical protein
MPAVDVDVSSLPDQKITVGGPLSRRGIRTGTMWRSAARRTRTRIGVPSIRAHPANFRLGFSVFGAGWLRCTVAGAGDNQPYVPNRASGGPARPASAGLAM